MMITEKVLKLTTTNTWIEAPLAWEGGVPVGWNSWSAAMADLDYDLYTSTSEFLKKKCSR